MNKYIYEALNNRFIISEEKIDNISMIKLMNIEKVDGYIVYKNNPLEMIIYNKDGSKATMCGNGIRCFLLHGLNKCDLTNKEYAVKVNKSKIKCEILSKKPFYSKVELSPCKNYPMQTKVIFFKGKIIKIYTLMIGTLNHIIFYDKNIDLNSLINHLKKIFCNQLGNISFVSVENKKTIHVLTYERGVGYTYSCGTGNAASFYILRALKMVEDNVLVINKGGAMKISYINNKVCIFGGATFVKEV